MFVNNYEDILIKFAVMTTGCCGFDDSCRGGRAIDALVAISSGM